MDFAFLDRNAAEPDTHAVHEITFTGRQGQNLHPAHAIRQRPHQRTNQLFVQSIRHEPLIQINPRFSPMLWISSHQLVGSLTREHHLHAAQMPTSKA